MNQPNAAARTAAPWALPRREAALWGKAHFWLQLLPGLMEMYENPPTEGAPQLSFCLDSPDEGAGGCGGSLWEF